MSRHPSARPSSALAPWAASRRAALLAALVSLTAPAHAQLDPTCALKAAAALGGEPSPKLAMHGSLGSLVEELLASPHFVETFASFVNSRFNRGASMTAEEDAVYYTVRHVLTERLPWSQVYLGEFGWSGPGGYPKLIADAAGVGYFTAPEWVRRYSGNDLDGAMLFAAYRVVQNTTGLVLVPSPFNADASSGAVGRERPACRSCHLEGPVALDRIAAFFPKRQGFGSRMTLTPPTNPTATLAGREVRSLRELVAALLDTDDHRFWMCRLVFEYAYGRPESTCEAPVFDRCVDALVRTDDIRAAIASVVDDAAFCGRSP